MSDRLFDVDDLPVVPLLRAPKRKGAARGVALDARFSNVYPPEWNRCPTCEGRGKVWGQRTMQTVGVPDGEVVQVEFEVGPSRFVMTALRELHGKVEMAPNEIGTYVGFRRRIASCPDCLGMGSVKAMTRLVYGHRCERCGHPYMPKGDAKMLGREPSGLHPAPFALRGFGEYTEGSTIPEPTGPPMVWTPWSTCDLQCLHAGPVRTTSTTVLGDHVEYHGDTQRDVLHNNFHDDVTWDHLIELGLEAEWRVLTVHHADGDKANLAWWNLLALCQRCHLEVQAKVVMERVYPYEHSEWFRPHAAGYYAWVYEQRQVTRGEAHDRMDELLAYERIV